MKYRKLGKSSLKLSVIGLGTGQFGSKPWGYGIRFKDENIIRIIQHAIESGINVFDTAETYGYGQSEMLLGKALRDYSRDDFVIISKVAPWNLRYEEVIKATTRSLKRLDLDIIDIYLVHYPNPLVPMKETFRAMEELIKTEKIRYIGVSNFNKNMLTRAQEQLSFSEIVVNEVEYNLFSRKAEKDIIPYCSKQNIRVLAYSPLSGGLLTGKYSSHNSPKDRARAFNFYARATFLEKAQPLFNVLKQIAKEKRVSVAQVSLSWIIKHTSCLAIPNALTLKEVEDNAKAGNLELSPEELKAINKVAISLGFSTYIFDHFIIRPTSWIKEAVKHFLLSNSNAKPIKKTSL